MKKIIATLALIIACQATFAQNIDTLFSQFKDKEGADYMNIPTLMLKFMRTFTKSNNDKSYRFIKGIKSVKVLDMEDCTQEVKAEFLQEVQNLNLNGYETLLQTKEDGEEVQLIAKMDEENINDLIILITGKDECGLTLMKGKIKKEDINVMMNDEKITIDGRE
ncbi:MAG: DUF4252 domain-containing protein [Bacteroides sp.]|nr:DUF4252 domain-containing protein [Bacteroides sp.]